MSQEPFLTNITESVCSRFKEARSILSYSEFLEETERTASLFCRSSTQYLYDAFQFFGTREVPSPTGQTTRFCLFDSTDDEQERWVVGQEEAQQSIYRMLDNFIQEGRNTRLLLLHGPNGSGKSSIIQSMIQALEKYSRTNEGAIYRYNWIFPSEKLRRSGIGFGQDEADTSHFTSYAHLEGDQIDARVPSFLKDHPLLLLPLPERQKFFEHLKTSGALPPDFQVSHYLRKGDLEPRSRVIFDAMMAHYGGDFNEVLRHIQVERFYISQRYRSGGVTIEPQMHVDAAVRQVSADRSLASLPKPLNNLNLFEAYGALVDANRGLVEYSDLLKRPIEAFKYLLGTCETGRINVEPVILYLDLLFVGNANELNLDRFKELAEFMSFKSRLELIRVPYILQFSSEQEIYDEFLERSYPQKPVMPHVTTLASLWAILTRLKRPNSSRLPESLSGLMENFTPLEKAHLYNDGSVPNRFTAEEEKMIRAGIKELFKESQNDVHYEGRIGASPREIRSALLNAAQNDEYPCLSPLALFDELEKLVQQRSVYEFLQLEPREGYYDASSFIDLVRNEHIRWVDVEFYTATGLVESEQYDTLFQRYIQHANAYNRNEKVENPVTLASEAPDQQLLKKIEDILLSSDDEPKTFRQNMINKVAVFSIEHPGEEVDLLELFKSDIEKVKEHFFSTQCKRLKRIAENCLVRLMDEKGNLSDAEIEEAEGTILRLQETFGYPKEGIRETLVLLLLEQYN